MLFLKTGVTLAFLQSSGTSPVLQDLSKMMESGSAPLSQVEYVVLMYKGGENEILAVAKSVL